MKTMRLQEKTGWMTVLALLFLSSCRHENKTESPAVQQSPISAVVATPRETFSDLAKKAVVVAPNPETFKGEAAAAKMDPVVAAAQIRQLLLAYPAVQKELITILKQAQPNVSVVPTEQYLAALGTPDAVLQLITLLNQGSPDSDAREQVAATASTIYNPQSADLLLEALRSADDQDVRVFAQQALSHMMDEHVLDKVIQRYDESQNEEEKEKLLNVVRQLENPEALDELLAMADEAAGNYEEPLARATVDALVNLGEEDGVGYLFNQLANAQGESEKILAEALARTVNPRALPLLMAMSSDKNLSIRRAAIKALGNYDAVDVEDVLQEALHSESDATVRQTAEIALKRVRGEFGLDFTNL